MTFELFEQHAKRAKEASGFDDYETGSATEEYVTYCKQAEEIAEQAKKQLSEEAAPADRIKKVDYLLNLYKSKKLSWMDDIYVNRARVPSVLIAGPANFPWRAKEKQNAREDSLIEQNPDYILDKIKGIGRNSKTIYSDDKDAVERIKAKIAALEAVPSDKYGYNKAEIRRLKERLLTLAPEEFKEQQKSITVNGVKTYNEIVDLWRNGIIHQSQYDSASSSWYFDLALVFSNGKQNYKELVSIEVDKSGENQISFNLEKGKTELIPLTDARKYSLIIGQISGSGNKAVMYQYLKGLAPKTEKTVAAATPENESNPDAITINGEIAKVIRNKEIMRLQLVFDGKPSEETRKVLKSNGFRWTPSHMAWQRLLNKNSELALKHLV